MNDTDEAIHVEQDWWKTLFDQVYLATDARSVCDAELTLRETDLLCRMVPLSPEHRVLDLCGGHGRHAIALCERGFARVTLADYSEFLLGKAAEHARQQRLPLGVVRCDARGAPLARGVFDLVMILGNSLGYIHDKGADAEILSEARRLLRPGGKLVVDVTDGGAVRRDFLPTAWHEIGRDIVVCRKRRLEGSVIHSREMVLSKKNGLVRDRGYAIRTYTARTLGELLASCGFSDTRIVTDFSPHVKSGDYGFMNRRMIAIGRK